VNCTTVGVPLVVETQEPASAPESAALQSSTEKLIGIGLNAAADVVSLLGIAVSSGTWPYYIPIWTHVVVTPLALPAIWAAELSDRLRGVPRDWLHLAGIAAISVLGVADFAVTLTQAIRYWR